jgi:hypothetical protein
VWSTIPRSPVVYDESLRDGWLTFESASGRRRLAPIPRGWENADGDRLELMCRAAEVARRSGATADPDAATPDPDAPRDPNASREPLTGGEPPSAGEPPTAAG